MTETGAEAQISASAPGKLLLCGEYAVLSGAAAICMAVDRRATVTITAGETDHHTVTSPGITNVTGRFRSRDGVCEWLAGESEFSLVDAVWRTAGVDSDEPLAIVLDTSAFLDQQSGVKIGVGSSAALTVALAGALCTATPAGADPTSIAIAAHRRFQEGLGSGADVACCASGGLIEYRMTGAAVHALAWPDGLVHTLLWSGVASSTGAKLRRLEQLDVGPSRAALADAAERTLRAWRAGAVDDILHACREFTQTLQAFSVDHALGIFDAGHAELAAAAAGAGLVYKPCGAGGGDVGLVLGDDAAAVAGFTRVAEAQGFCRLNLHVDPHGLQVVR